MPRSKEKAMEIDVTTLLHEDHQKVRELFFKFSKAEEDAEKSGLVKQILTELFIHATLEEEIVYPITAKKAEDAEDLIDEAETEHRVVKFLMAELSNMKPSDEKYDAKVLVLCELVNHHIREEEKEMFDKLRESGVDLEKLAEQVKSRKEELQQKPLPGMNATLSMGNASAKRPAVLSPKSNRGRAKTKRSA